MNNTVSIIVPVYNTEKYLSRCIESILNQSYVDIELILINDGSTDRSGEICDQFARTDNRIIVEHRENSGVSNARNAGIIRSSGEYLQFVDSDDYIDKDMTRSLFDAIEHKSEVDMVISGYKIIENETGGCFTNSYVNNTISFSFQEIMDIYDELYSNLYLNLLWNKIFKKRIIEANNILFDPNIDLGEDLIFNISVIRYCRNIVIIPSAPYYYVQYKYNNNLTTKYRENIYENQKLLFDMVMKSFSSRFDYSKQINSIESKYSMLLISYVIMHIADNINLINFNIFKKKIITISYDEILFKKMNHIDLKQEEKLIRFFVSYKMYISFFVYAKVKKYIKIKFPSVLNILKKLVKSTSI